MKNKINNRSEYRALQQQLDDNRKKIRDLNMSTTKIMRQLREYNRDIKTSYDSPADDGETPELKIKSNTIYQSENFDIIKEADRLLIKCHPKRPPWKSKCLDYEYKPELTLTITNALTCNNEYTVGRISVESHADCFLLTNYVFNIEDAASDITDIKAVYAHEPSIYICEYDRKTFYDIPEKTSVEHFCYMLYIRWLCANLKDKISKCLTDNMFPNKIIEDIRIQSIERQNDCIIFKTRYLQFTDGTIYTERACVIEFDNDLNLITRTKTTTAPAVHWLSRYEE